MTKKHWALALAVSLGTIATPGSAWAAGDDDTSGSDETRSAYEGAVKLVEGSGLRGRAPGFWRS